MHRMPDPAPFASLRPLDVAAYLRANGWSLADEDARVAVWEKIPAAATDAPMSDDGGSVEVQQPLHSDWRDYPRRLQALVETVSEAEGRRIDAVLRDMSSSTWDTMRVRAVSAHADEGSLAVDDAARMLACIERVMLAAACAALRPQQRAYHSRKPAAAVEFVRALRVGQTERGSFVWTVQSQIPPQVPLGADDPEPFPRKVVRVAGEALATLADAARRETAAGGLGAFEAGILQGVSADLCEAIGLLEETGSSLRRVEFQFSWALIRPAPGRPAAPASFARDALAVVKAAGRALRERLPVEDFELTGYVMELGRAGDLDAGNATIAANVDGTQRKVTVILRDDDWRQAHIALGKRQRVSCEGLLRKQRGSFSLENVRNFIVDSDE
jgi:hypothetical protein